MREAEGGGGAACRSKEKRATAVGSHLASDPTTEIALTKNRPSASAVQRGLHHPLTTHIQQP